MGVDMTLYQVEPSKLRAPDITTEDFYQAIARIKPSVCEADLERQIEFTNTFGQDG
jgi:SpoVK/Ycf46/Vps4 family AAA+-type ATPase